MLCRCVGAGVKGCGGDLSETQLWRSVRDRRAARAAGIVLDLCSRMFLICALWGPPSTPYTTVRAWRSNQIPTPNPNTHFPCFWSNEIPTPNPNTHFPCFPYDLQYGDKVGSLHMRSALAKWILELGNRFRLSVVIPAIKAVMTAPTRVGSINLCTNSQAVIDTS